MTEAEELELLELEEQEAKAHGGPPQASPEMQAYLAAKAKGDAAASGPGMLSIGKNAGGRETFLNRGVDALPMGRPVANALSALVLRTGKAFGAGSPTVELTPQALEEAKSRGMNVDQSNALPDLADAYRGARGTAAHRTAEGSEEHPWASGLGTATGTILSLLAPLPKATVGTGASGRVLSNALTAGGYGALNGAANSRGDLTHGDVGQVALDTLGLGGLQQAGKDFSQGNYGHAALDVMGAGGIGGAITGGALGAGIEGLRASGLAAKAGDALSGVFNRFANRKALNALGAMKPELNRLGSEEAQQLGQYANDKGILGPFSSRAAMAGRIDSARQAAGNTLSESLAGVSNTGKAGDLIHPEEAARQVEALADQLAAKPALAGIANKFRAQATAIRQATGANGGPMTVQAFEENIVRPFKQMTNWNADLALPKETLQKLPMALEGMVEKKTGDIARRTASPALEQYLAAKQDYGKLASLRDIAEEGLKRQASNHTFGLKDALTAVAAAGAGAHHGTAGSIAYGLAGLGAGKLASRFGDQMSATGARSLVDLLRRAPTAAGNVGYTAEELANALRAPPNMTPAFGSGDDAERQQMLAQAIRQGGGL